MSKRSPEWRPSRSLNTVINNLKYLVLGFVLILFSLGVFSYTRVGAPAHVEAATSSTVSYQARLLTSAGNTVPDGYYNIQFKIYDGGTQGGPGGTGEANAGTLLWTETRDFAGTDDRVRVVNGYLSVNLGSVTSLGTLNWDQELWLTMSVRGSGTCDFATTCTPADAEMLAPGNKRTKLTAVPYAFSAGQLAKSSGANRGTLGFNTVANDPAITLPDATGIVCLQGASACSFAPSTGGTGYINNSTSLQTTANYHIQAANSGANGTIGGIIRGAANGQTVDLFQLQATNGTVLTHFDATGRLAIGSASAPAYPLDVTGTARITGGVLMDLGSTITWNDGFNTLGVVSGTNQWTFTGYDGKFNFNDSNAGGATIFSLANDGQAIFKNSVDSGTAFQVQNSAGVTALNVSTSTIPNLIANGSLESSTNGWTAKGAATISPDASQFNFGKQSLKVATTTTANDGAAYTYRFKNSTQYTLSLYARLSTGSMTTFVMGHKLDSATADADCLTGQTLSNSVWTRFTCTFTTGTPGINDNPGSIYIKQSDASARNIYIDGVQLEEAATASAFNNQNLQVHIESGTTSNLIVLGGQNSGELTEFRSSTNQLPASRMGSGVVAANGYAYVLGGTLGGGELANSQSTVYYAKLNADGSTGSWTTSATPLPAVRSYLTSVAANGYIYAIGGANTTAAQTTVYYAKLNADGSTGAWQTNSNALPQALYRHSSFANNGYVYVLGGYDGTTTYSTVYYAKLNADGSTGAWQTNSNALTAARCELSSSVANGYVYAIAGNANCSSPSLQSTIYYARINNDGTIGTWTTSTTTAPAAMAQHTSAVANGYLYIVGGGSSGSIRNTTHVARLNPDGSIGSWAQNTALFAGGVASSGRIFHGTIVSNGNIYVIGGQNGSAAMTNVFYASTQRLQVGGALDLVSLAGGDLSTYSGGGELTAGNTNIVGALQVQGAANIAQSLSVGGMISAQAGAAIHSGSAGTVGLLVKGASGQTANLLEVQNSSGSKLFSVDANGALFMGTGTAPLNMELTRTVPTTVGDYIDIGTLFTAQGTHNVRISITVADGGFSVAKTYTIPLRYLATTSAANDYWEVIPGYDSGEYSGNDFALGLWSPDGNTYLRLFRKAGSTAGSAKVRIESTGLTADTFTATSTTGSGTLNSTLKFGSLYQAYSGTYGGNIGIGTMAPTAKLHTVASGAKTANYSGNLLTNTATSSTNSITKAGLEVTSTGTWNGTSASNIGIYVSSVTGGTNNYDAIFNGGGVATKVGIGTLTPTAGLHIAGNEPQLKLQGISTGASNVAYTMFVDSVGTQTGIIGDKVTTDSDIYLMSNANLNFQVGGANTFAYLDGTAFYMGNGATNASPTNFGIQATGGSGTNIAGATLTLAGGRGTGSAVGGDILFRYSPAGGAGSSLNALQTACSISGTNGSFSCPGAGASSERFGAGSAATGASDLAVGRNASATGSAGVAVGDSAASGFNALAIGYSASATFNNSIAIGNGATANGGNSGIALGQSATAVGNNSIALGQGATTTAANQWVVNGITSAYFGNGVTNAAPTAVTLQGTGSSTDGTAGAAVTVQGGAGTIGNSNGGNLLLNGGAKAGTGAVGHVILQGTNSGFIGIGDSTPSSKLSIGGSGVTNGITLGDDAADPVSLYRSAANVLSLGQEDDLKFENGSAESLTVLSNANGVTLYSNNAGANDWVLSSQLVGEGDERLIVQSDGQMLWGDGTNPQDTNLYRSAADTLKTDDKLVVSGAAANVSNGSILVVDGNMTSTTNQQFGIRSAPNIAPGSASTQVYNGIQGVPVTNSANVAGARLVGVSGAPYVYGSSTVGSVVGLYAFNQADNTSTITDSYQILAGNPFKAGGATITNNYGMYVEAQTSGTNNVGIGIGEVTGTAQTNLLIGATQPAGSWSIYNASTDANYFAGSFDTQGTIQAGTGNENLTLVSGKIDADALTLTVAADGGTGTSSGSGLIVRSDGIGLLQGCSDGQILKWVESTDTWDCAADGAGGSTAWSSLTVPTDNLNLDHAGNTTTFTTDTATGTFFTMIGNSISSGTILQVSSVSTGLTSGSLAHIFASGNPGASWTGSLLKVEHGISTDADVDGNAIQVGLTGAGAGSGVALNVTTAQTGSGALALRVNDDGTYADSTPFAVTAAGDVGIGTDAPSAKLHVAGDAIFRNGTNSATAIQIQNATAADTLFTVDTTARGASGGNLLKVGNSTGTDGDLTIFKLDSATANPTSNLAALNGGLFYNSTTNKVNIIENGAVKTLCNTTDLACGTGGASAIQASYDASTTVTSGIITTAANKNFYIRAGSGFNNTSLLVVQNAASANLLQVDSTNSGNITLLGNYSGEPSSWSTDTDGSLPTRYHHGSVIANGYMYVIAGKDSLIGSTQTTAYYAKINADGTVGTWATTSALPAAREVIGGSVVTANGYIYVIGGNNSGAQSTVYYAKVNSDGTLNSWQTNSYALGCTTPGCGSPVTRSYTSAAVANGYIYVVGGTVDSNASGAQATTYYAKLNADGSTGAWSTTLTLPAARYGDLNTSNVVTANGYIYYLAGNDTAAATSSKVYYAQLNANGTLTGTGGNWLTDTDLANANCRGSFVTANGFIHIYNNNNNAVCYLPLNANGTLGTEVTATTTLPDVRNRGTVATANGYLYLAGGLDTIGTAVNTVYYASLGRIKLGGSLDLVGLSGENLANPGSGGSLTAGNTHIAGSLQVQGQANFAQSVSVDKEFVANSTVLFKNAANSTSAFQVQASGTATPILNVDTTNSRVGIGTATPLFDLHMYNSNNFGSLAVGGAFVDQNSYFGDEFMTPSTTADITTDTTGTPASGAYGTGMGDDRRWGVYMDDVSSCTASTIDDSLNGVLRLSLPQADKGCMIMVDEAINNARLFLDADNLPTMLFKVKPSQADATSHINIGMGDATDGAVDSTPGNNFLGFTNNGGTSWVGHARSNELSGGTSNTAACATINASNFALLMVKVISASEVKFYVDANVSDGVSFIECASITTENNIPDASLAPQVHWHESTGGTASNLEVDFFRVWQDDAPTSGDPDPAPATELQTDTSNTVTILNNGNYDNLTVTGTTTTKDLVVTGASLLNTLVVEHSASIGELVVRGGSQFQGNISVGGHIITAGNTPVGEVLGATGIGATVVIDGNDTAGTITITTGSNAMIPGDLSKVIFNKPFGKVPKIVLSAQDEQSENAKIFPSAKTVTEFMLKTSLVLPPNTTYTFDYFIIE